MNQRRLICRVLVFAIFLQQGSPMPAVQDSVHESAIDHSISWRVNGEALALPVVSEHGSASIGTQTLLHEVIPHIQPRLDMFDGLPYQLLSEQALPHEITVQSYTVDGKPAWVVHSKGEPQAVIRDRGDHFSATALGKRSSEVLLQQYFAALYNFMGYYALTYKEDIQVHESILDRSLDRLELYRTLAQRRQTMSPLAPVYAKQKLSEPVKMALKVDPSVSHIEAALISQLLGNPDIALKVVVGTTPHQLFLTLHSSVHRHFLSRDVFDYDNAAGTLSIYGQRIRVIPSWNAMSSEEWAALNIRTVVSTYNATDEKGDMAKHLHGTRSGDPAPIHLVSLQPDFVSRTAGLYAEGLSHNGVYAKATAGDLQLANSRLVIPLQFVRSLFNRWPNVAKSAKVALHLSTPQRNDTPILDKPTQVGGAGNVVSGRGLPLRTMLEVLGDGVLPVDHLQMPTIQYDPTQVGTRTDLTLHMPLSALAQSLELGKMGKNSREEVETTIRAALLEVLQRENGFSSVSDGLDVELFLDDKLAPSYARGKTSVLLSLPQIQVSVTGQGGSREVSVMIPLMFDDHVQDVQHLVRVLTRIGAEENRNLPGHDHSLDRRHSTWQQQADLSLRWGTLPPRAPDLPFLIELRDRPLALGVMGLGRTGGLVVRNLMHTLNLRLVAIAGTSPEEVEQTLRVDTAQGTWTSHGQDVSISARAYKNPKGPQIGSVKINSDKSIALLPRGTPNQIPWRQVGVDIVFDATGQFTNPEDAQGLLGHLDSARGDNKTGARAAFLSAPFKWPENMSATHPVLISGINHDTVADYLRTQIENNGPMLLSGASCTTTCGAFLLLANAKVFREAPLRELLKKAGIEPSHLGVKIISATGLTVHALTNTQSLTDALRTRNPKDHTRLRAARAILPTETGLSKALQPLRVDALSDIARVIDATSERVPTETGSHLIASLTWEISGLTANEEYELLKKDAKSAFEKALKALQHRIYDEWTNALEWKGVVEHRQKDEATGSNQVVGSRAAALFDSQQTSVRLNKTAGGIAITMRIAAWYDNENGFSARQVASLDWVARQFPLSKDFEGLMPMLKNALDALWEASSKGAPPAAVWTHPDPSIVLSRAA